MFIEILQHTPLYIYWMFFSLLFVGLLQKKTRTLGIKRALGIPILLFFLSFYGFYIDFSLSFLSISFYLLSFSLMFLISQKYRTSSHIRFFKNDKTFIIEGSFIPLLVMMLVFFTKYFLAVVLIKNPSSFENIYFISIFSFAYGLFTSIFFLRFFILFKKMRD